MSTMRLKSVWISEYKNLKGFSVDLDIDNFIEVFVGKNGSGKSNFFEALILIFQHFFDEKKIPNFYYTLSYNLDNSLFILNWNADSVKVMVEKHTVFETNDSIYGTRSSTVDTFPISSKNILLPDNILIYYSGHNNQVYDLLKESEESFKRKIRTTNIENSRKFIGIGIEYKELLLTSILLLSNENIAKQYVCQKLGIKENPQTISFRINRPYFADKSYSIEEFDISTHYWGAQGNTNSFLKELEFCIKGEFKHRDIYDSEDDVYTIPVDVYLFQNRFSDSSEIFRQFDNLKLLGMIENSDFELIYTDKSKFSLSQFSDGQFQTVYISAIVELFKDRNCITLLDEPDSFLHPEWQFDFFKQVNRIADKETKKNHFLISSHSAATLSSLDKKYFNVFETSDDKKITIDSISKDEIVKLLSGNKMIFSNNEIIMNITTFLKNTTQPVLFTEGITDEYILIEAWQKIYSDELMPFCIQNAFDRIFLRNLFSRDEIRKNFPDRLLFALFDFDEAYDDWKGMTKKGEQVNDDPFTGLISQLQYKSHYAMLLPVPKLEIIRKQVLNSENKPWGKGSESHLSIEILFYEEELENIWFRKQEVSCGGQVIKFSGDKVKFAEEYIPTLDSSNFEIFRPLFEFIKSKCQDKTFNKRD